MNRPLRGWCDVGEEGVEPSTSEEETRTRSKGGPECKVGWIGVDCCVKEEVRWIYQTTLSSLQQILYLLYLLIPAVEIAVHVWTAMWGEGIKWGGEDITIVRGRYKVETTSSPLPSPSFLSPSLTTLTLQKLHSHFLHKRVTNSTEKTQTESNVLNISIRHRLGVQQIKLQKILG